MFTVGQNSVFTVGKIRCSHFAKISVHSWQKYAYASKKFKKLLKQHGIKGSMSRKGNCWDNAVAESFFGSLKQDRVQWRHYQTRHDAQQDILNYIAVFL